MSSELARCPCGHPWGRHVERAGCMAMANDWTETDFCACQQDHDTAAARAPEGEGE